MSAESSVPHPAATGRPELLAPAGNWACARAAVENGADAIYFGLSRFNARMRADNFTEADLPALMEFLHRRGVRGYVTFNTLVFADELAAAEAYLRAIIAAGVDAAIVQDIGVCRLIRRLSPDFPIHGSTQMTVTSAAGVEFVRDLGCQLVVLARECSVTEINAINAAVSSQESQASRMPLEVFVHGALCVAYSGQCLTSEALGGRSANRGECAQACRMPYELVADGQTVPLGDRRYLLSPQDLAGLSVVPDLARAGVSSLKIEGRLKAPEYVASITRVYRAALDRLGEEKTEGRGQKVEGRGQKGVSGGAQGDHAGAGSEDAAGRAATVQKVAGVPAREAAERYELEMGFSRGLYTGWLGGIDNQRLVHARFGKKRGVLLGTVRRVRGERVFLAPEADAPLKAGDGVVFDGGQPDQPEEGGRVYTVDPAGGELALTFGRGSVDLSRVQPGQLLWKTSDPELDRRVRQTFAGDAPRFQRPVDFEVHGHAGGSLTLVASDRRGHVVQRDSAVSLSLAEQQPLSTEKLAEQLGRLGGTAFRLGELANRLEGAVILPVSELNRLRREAVAELEALRAAPKRWQLNEGRENASWRVEQSEETHAQREGAPSLAVGLSSTHRIDSHPELRCREPKGLPSAVSQTRFSTSLHSAQDDSGMEWKLKEHSTVEGPSTPLHSAQDDRKENGKTCGDGTQLLVLVRNLGQLDAVLGAEIGTVYCDFEDPKGYREAVRRFRVGAEARTGAEERAIFVAPPRVFKTGEEWILKQVRSCEADGYLVRNYDHLRFFAGERCVGEFSLNVANPLTAEYFMERYGLERLTASYDLNAAQLEALLQGAPPAWFEVTIHQHMPMFHMEHCVFCAFLSTGTDYRNCGRPCDKQEVRLRDRVGLEHPLKADAGCRNTVFNARAQTGAEAVERLRVLGLRHFRVEFVNETAEAVTTTLARYWALLRGEIDGGQLWRELKLHNQLGVTRGQMESADVRRVFPRAASVMSEG